MLNEDLQNENEPHLTDASAEQTAEPPVHDFEPEAPVAEPEADGEAIEETDAGMPRLVVKRNGAETDTQFFIHSPAVIGRFDPAVGPVDVDLADLPEGAYVSRKHAKIVHDGENWKVMDLGSSNGTFVLRDDFERVEEAELGDGQEFALGNARFVFHLN
jgi:hypothetical protein